MCPMCRKEETEELCVYCAYDAQRWLDTKFAYEYCELCGGDADDHTAIVIFPGTFFAYCDFPLREDIGDVGGELELTRRHNRQSGRSTFISREPRDMVDPQDPRDIEQLWTHATATLQYLAEAFEDADQIVDAHWIRNIAKNLHGLKQGAI